VAFLEQLIQAAASSAAEGELSMTELHYLQAVDLFKEAASTVPAGHVGERESGTARLYVSPSISSGLYLEPRAFFVSG
jgi:hypothetical protein